MESLPSSAVPMFLLHTSHGDDSLSTTLISSTSDHLLPSSALAPSPQIVATTENSTNCFVPDTLELVSWRIIQLFLIVLYIMTSLTALIGNLVVILVSVLGSESAPTIRLCLANLAVSDVILSIIIPFTFTDYMLGQWYHATLHPFSSVHRWLCSHTRPLLLSTWIIGALYASIIMPHTGTRAFQLANITYYECSYDNGASPTSRRIFMTTNLLLTFLLPLLVLITVYTAIMRKLMAEQSQQKADTTISNGGSTPTTTFTSLHRPQTYHFTNNSNGTTAASSSATLNSTSCRGEQCNPTNGVTKTLVVVSRREEKAGQKKKRKKKRKKETTAVVNRENGDGVAFVAQSMTTIHTNGSGEASSSADAAAQLFSNSSSNSHGRHVLKLYQAGGGRKKSAPTLQLNSAVSLRKSANTNRSKTIKMLFMVMAMYGICWAPIKLYQFLIDYNVLGYCSEFSLQALVAAYFACHWLAMANSAVNPIIYSFMSRSFRNDFRKITSSCRPGGRPSSKINRHFSLRTASSMV